MKTTHRVLSLTLAVVIALGAFAVPMNFGIKSAYAATVTMETSADDHGKKFFGNSLLQVIITDDSKDDSSTIETVSPDIEVRDDSGTLVTTLTPDIDETGDDTSTFEWYASDDDSSIEPQDPENDAGNPADADFLDRSQPLEDGWSLKIIYKGVSTTITYTDQPSSISVDRDSSYGSDNLLFLTIADQDANADPTHRDVVITDDAADFPEIAGDSAHNDGIVCTETGDNSAEFECEYQIGIDLNATNSEASVSFTVTDQSTYMNDTDDDGVIEGNGNDDTNLTPETSTDDITVSIENIDGDVSPVSTVTMSSELPLTLTDPDRNLSSKDEDTVDSDADTFDSGENDGTIAPEDLFGDFGSTGLIVYIDSDGGDVEAVPLTETQDSSGVFLPDLANDQLKVSFLADGDTPTENNGILEFTADNIDEDIVIAYIDPQGADAADDLTASQVISLTRTPGTLAVTASAGINSDFTITLTDSDLNDNPKTKDSYTIAFDDGQLVNDVEYPLERAGDTIGDLATLELTINGDNPTFDDDLTYTLTETGLNTGVFTAKLDMQEILNSTDVAVEDGDKLKFTYHDFMGDTERESSATLTIGRADSAVDLSRDELPIPPDPTGTTNDALGSDSVVINLQITDPDKNENSGSQDTLVIDLGNNMVVDVDGDGFSESGIDDETTNIDDTGVALEDIMPNGLDGLVLKETGANTGVFEEDLVFNREGVDDFQVDEWQDLRITFIYTDDQGDENSAGVTFRGHDSIVDVEPTSLSTTGTLKVTLQDEDLNLDDSEIEEFDCTFDDADMLAFAAENDDIDNAGQCVTFTETGEDTGIFEGEMELGNDINVLDNAAGDQASNIHITYNEEVDSSGDEPDATEVDVPIVTATGTIQVTPALVGPGTEITVHILDSDLNETPDGRDTVDEADGFVTFRSDRTEVGKSDIGMQETGPSTGVFEFKIQLNTDAQDCADDDLGLEKYNAATTSNDEGEIGACPGDLVSIKYDDNQDANGRSTTVSAVVEVKSWDPEFQADKDSYSVGDKLTLSISDPDANRDSDVADTLRDIRVYSDTDQVGETVSAIETGKDTGVFKLSIALSGTSQSGGVEVKTGDDVTVQYTDEFPADFTDNEEDKDFRFTTTVGNGPVGDTSFTPTAPSLKDVTGNELSSVTAGQQVVLSTSVVNNLDRAQPFAAILEVRDSSGVTVFLAWQTGSLNQAGQTQVGLSWTPDNPGNYTIRTFVISDLNNPQILSKVMESQITVS